MVHDPARRYGGVEALVFDLTTALRERGHTVLVAAPGDSSVEGLMPGLPTSRPEALGNEIVAVSHALRVSAELERFGADVVHDHTPLAPLTAPRRCAPTLMTAHNNPSDDFGELLRMTDPSVRLVAISHAQATLAPDVNWAGVVPNGIRVRDYPFGHRRGDDLVFLGRMSPSKGCADAIRVARQAGRRLLIAARVAEPTEVDYFERHVRPELGADVVYVGELGFADKTRLLSTCAALVLPLSWDEPFGLVAAEAQACGTPVLTTPRGAMPEVVDHGVTGWICRSTDEMARRVRQLERIDPRTVRRHAERRLDISLAAAGYESLYLQAMDRSTVSPTLHGEDGAA